MIHIIPIVLQFLLVVMSLCMLRVTRYILIWIISALASGIMVFKGILLFIYKGDINPNTISGIFVTFAPLFVSALLVVVFFIFYRMYKFRLNWESSLETTLHKEEKRTKKIEEDLILLSAAVEQSPSIVVITDIKGNIEYVNPKFTEITGYESDEVIGKNPRILKSEYFHNRTYRELWDKISSGEEWRGEFHNKKKNGDLYWEAASISSIKDSNGKIKSYLAVKEDVTERKNIEEALKKSEEKIKSSLEEKSALLRELYHRTKNNMQVISAMLNLSASKLNDNKVAEVFRDLDNRIQSMSLVHEKLYQSRNLSIINLKEYISDLCHSLIASYHTIDCKVSCKFDLEDISVLIDAAIPLGLIINELVSNAFKHAFPGREKGEISIKLKAFENSILKIEIADNGIGSNLDFSMDRPGSIGLQTVFAISKDQLHGDIKMDTKYGFKFYITFNNSIFESRV